MKRAAAVLVLGLTWAVVPRASWASCAPGHPDPTVRLERALDTSPVVFVGTALDDGRNVRVQVREVWRGPDLAGRVAVRGGPQEAGLVTSVDRTYAAGTTYLFFPTNPAPPFDDNACTETREFTADLARYAPGDARAPRASSATFPWGPVAAGIGLAAAFAAMIAVYRRASSTRAG